jgi:hypothetical protein
MSGQPLNMAQVVRWIARLLNLLSTVLLLLFLFGEPFHVSRITPAQWLGLALFPVGVVAGFIVAWRKEGLGAAITNGSLLSFYLVFVFLLSGNLKQGLGFLVFALPGFLFLVARRMTRTHNVAIQETTP